MSEGEGEEERKRGSKNNVRTNVHVFLSCSGELSRL